MITYIKNALLLCLVGCVVAFTSCSDNNDELASLPEGQGEVMFKFVRNSVYTVSSLEEMARLKVTLKKGDRTIVLPTIDLSGDENALSSAAVRLDNGEYQVVKYVAYNSKGTQVQEAYLDEDNLLTVEHGQIRDFYFPISIRIVYVNNQLRNMLYGICTEVLGADSTKWPKTWREENKDFLKWENLEFEVDDYGNISYLACIVFDEKFAGMKKLPSTVSLFPTLEGIHIINLPELEELPDNLDKSPISSISLLNTGLKSFPKNFEKIRNLRSLTVSGSKLTELPDRLGELEKLRYVDISGNDITTFPATLATKWKELASLRIAKTKLSSLPSNIFSIKKISTFDFCNNPSLSSLPENRGDGAYMGGLLLDNCGLTALPKIAQTRMLNLSLANNKITSLSEADVNALSSQIESVNLDGNKIGSFPKMTSASLMGISLNDCGLTTMPDLSKLPNLRSISLAKNSISAVGDGAFTANKYLTILNLADNATLTTISSNAGFNLVPQEDKINGATVTVNKPFYLRCVDVDNCPNLTWSVPGTWCCIKNITIDNKEDLELPLRAVIVYNRKSPGVTRQACPVCGKSVYEFRKTFEEIYAETKQKYSK